MLRAQTSTISDLPKTCYGVPAHQQVDCDAQSLIQFCALYETGLLRLFRAPGAVYLGTLLL